MKWIAVIGGAIAFYTSIPISSLGGLEFTGIARLAPAIGILIGLILGLIDWGLSALGMPILVRSAVVVALWVGITGGLHLDGAMDTADGFGVTNPERRLEVMSDSATGAFGAIAGILILLLKTTALASLTAHRIWVITAVAGWGRWGQLWAIWRYPYLKPTGKGAFHKEAIQSYGDVLPTLGLLLILSGGHLWYTPAGSLGANACLTLGWGAIALISGFWFHRQLGGHTGDTYGAVVEWTESLGLVWATLFFH